MSAFQLDGPRGRLTRRAGQAEFPFRTFSDFASPSGLLLGRAWFLFGPDVFIELPAAVQH